MRSFAGCSDRSLPMGTHRRRGYTLVELLMATTLTLMLMGVVVTIFASVSGSIHNSRSALEMMSALRAARSQLQLDLEGVTVSVSAFPPRDPASGEGYLEIIEGPVGPVVPPGQVAVNNDTGQADSTVGDFDDIIKLTTRSRKGPFVGRYRDRTIQSEEAEVIWFVRGRTLYRRVLLIAPQAMSDADDNHDANVDPTDRNGVVDPRDLTDSAGVHAFHEWYDLSARPEVDGTGTSPTGWGWVLNTLGDLTKRENRYAHRVHPLDAFPFSASRWGQLGLPTLRECSHPNWMTWPNAASRPAVTPQGTIDLWTAPHPWPEVEPATGTLQFPPPPNPPAAPRFLGPRVAEDVILTNVIGFDVKVWDPAAPIVMDSSGTIALLPGDSGYLAALQSALQSGILPVSYGAYVDLNYMCLLGAENLNNPPVDPAAPAPEPAYRNWVLNGTVPEPHFYGAGRVRSGLRGTDPSTSPPAGAIRASVYDTWSFHYENDGIDGWIDWNGNGVFDAGIDRPPNGIVDEGTDGFDNDLAGSPGYGIVDDPGERETMPPYPVPLRGVQIRIRTFEPDSRQVREVTVVSDFLSE